ncbi:hypothetical protein HZL08_07965 [Enterobacter roggenkampii]|uniref:hypothetical protein n=1 Tax=Enterobacter roggenkampii TaxID=1812935 RepID=UPI0015CCDCB3|nr:hypothetical protein [Enterobacter roggenkampii]QLG83993.1 hypothetical protein HZL08_07965 [Enterobacter roggenkampii]
MGIYLDSKVLSGIDYLDSIIKRDLEPYDGKEQIINNSSSDFLNITLKNAWDIFYSLIKTNVNSLDDNTKFNQEHISSYISFNSELYAKDKIDFLSCLLRVLYEFQFWTGANKIGGILSYDTLTTLSNLFDAPNGHSSQFSYIRDRLPIALTQWLVSSDNFNEAKSFINNVKKNIDEHNEQMAVRKAELLSDLDNRKHTLIKEVEATYANIKHEIKIGKQSLEQDVRKILDSLDEVVALEKRVGDLRSEYNFVGLSSGFDKIKQKKEKELRDIEGNYRNLFGCIFITPVAILILHFFLPGVFPKDYTAIFLALPFVTIEMALIYFFRLSYLEAKSIRTQLVQIDLRLSLCAFIDDYVVYRKKNEANIDKVLDSFDSLIFSPIQTNENNIPSMFDGVEAIAGLAEKITKK